MPRTGSDTGGDEEGWRTLRDDGQHAIFHAGHLPLGLYADESGAYLEVVGRPSPEIYVVLRGHGGGGSGGPVRPALVTASPDEAAAYGEGDDAIQTIPMPPAVVAWVRRFATKHHREQPFVRRNRRTREAQEEKARPPRQGVARKRPAWRAPGAS